MAMISHGHNLPSSPQVSRYLDVLGIPRSMGALLAGQIGSLPGKAQGALKALVDLQGGLATKALDSVLGKGVGAQFGPGFVPRHRCGGNHLHRHRSTHLFHDQVGKKAQVGQRYGFNWGPFKLEGKITGQQYAGSFAKPVQLANDKLLYQGRMYDNLGAIWRDLRDGKIDGLATARLTMPNFNFLPLLPGLGGPDTRPGAPGGTGAPGTSQPGGTSAAGDSGAAGASDIMSGGGSLEDKLLLLMDKLAKHLDKQIEDQMKKIESEMAKQKQEGQGSSGGGGGGIGGLLGGIAGAVGGPIGGLAGQALGGLMGGGGGAQSGGAQGGGSSTDKSNLQLLQAQLQQMVERRNQMFQTMTQMLKSLNDTSLAVIRNLKA